MLVADIAPPLLRFLWFIWGALWGSFFNVAIYRWPREMSVVSPPSHCPSCGAPVPAWRNLPILAYVLQRGRAACCGAKLTPRYLVVELLTGCLAVAVAERFVLGSSEMRPMFDATVEALVYFTFVGGLVIATFVDLEHLQIPDEVSIGGTAFGLATLGLRRDVDVDSLVLGAGAAYLFVMLVPVWSWERLTGQRGMGEGDAKFLMFIGVFLGWQGVLFVIAAASLQGAVGYFVRLALQARSEPSATSAASSETQPTETSSTEPSATGTTEPSATASNSEDDEDVVEVEGPDALEAKLDVDLPGEVLVTARRDGDLLRLVAKYRPSLGAPDAPHIPFGPFLALAALEFLFFGQRIVDWYLTSFVEH